jgi:hypothetical protein
MTLLFCLFLRVSVARVSLYYSVDSRVFQQLLARSMYVDFQLLA